MKVGPNSVSGGLSSNRITPVTTQSPHSLSSSGRGRQLLDLPSETLNGIFSYVREVLLLVRFKDCHSDITILGSTI